MKAVIVAAGRGRRLGPNTSEIPKCMVEVGGRPMLHQQLDALAAAGVTDFVIVRGYLGDRIVPPAHLRDCVRFVENPAWATNNILASLLYAEAELSAPGGFVFSYSDIVYAPGVARALLAAEVGDAALIVDRGWAATYDGRDQHPVSEAELAAVRDDGRVTRVGKGAVPRHEAGGEFIGLARFSPSGGQTLVATWKRALAAGLDAPYGRAPALRVAYVTDALNDMADAGADLRAVFIDGTWREIDTEQDLARGHAAVASWADRGA